MTEERRPDGKSWDEFHRLDREAREVGAPRPNPYHYFADRHRENGYTPHGESES